MEITGFKNVKTQILLISSTMFYKFLGRDAIKASECFFTS